MDKTSISKHIVSVAFIVLIIAVFLSVFAHKAVQVFGLDGSKAEQQAYAEEFEASATDLYGNTLSAYARDPESSAQPGGSEQRGTPTLYPEKLQQYASFVTDLIERKYSKQFFAKLPFFESKRQFDKLMGMNLSTSFGGTKNDTQYWADVLLEDEDHNLIYNMDDADIRDNIDRVVAFGRKVQDQGKNFLFFITPEKPELPAAQYRGIFKSSINEKKLELERALSANGLPFCSCWEALAEEGHATSDLFFRTDHHWLPQTALKADRLLAETMNEQFGYSADLSAFDLSAFNLEYLDKPFLGQQGIKVTSVYAEPEPFPILTPKYHSDVDIFIAGDGRKHGSIEDVLLNKYNLHFSRWDILDALPYDYYGYGCQQLIQIHNNDLHNGKRVLLIRSSFGGPMYPFLTPIAEQIDAIDPRRFAGSIEKYIEVTQPDTVVIIGGIGLFCQNEGQRKGDGEVSTFFDYD